MLQHFCYGSYAEVTSHTRRVTFPTEPSFLIFMTGPGHGPVYGGSHDENTSNLF